MYKVKVSNQCGCFKRSGLEGEIEFDNKDDALLKAQSIVSKMRDTFCGKHTFTLLESDDEFNIDTKERLSQEQINKNAGCGCGSGNCL